MWLEGIELQLRSQKCSFPNMLQIKDLRMNANQQMEN